MSAVTDPRAEILATALERRPAGRPLDAAAPAPPLDAYLAAARQLDATLRSLTEAEWEAPAHELHGRVRGVVAHLVGVERLALAWIEVPATAPLLATDHLAGTRDAVVELAGTDGATVGRLWHEAATRLHAAAAAADPSKPVLAHDLLTDVDGLLVLRAFELWAHLLDVCRATGRPEPPVEDSRMALMASRLMGAVAGAVALRGSSLPTRSVRFVLTGRAGGCFDIALGPLAGPGPAEATVVADAVDVCRLAARRLDATDLDAHLEGDVELAATVLAALDAFAQD